MQAISNHKVFDNLAVSSTTTYYSGSRQKDQPAATPNIGTDVNGAGSVSFHGEFSSTPNGTLTVEYSNATDADVRQAVDDWDTYTLAADGGFVNGVAAITAGVLTTGLARFGISLRFRFRRVRLKYTNASSSGTLTVIVTVKAVA